MKNKENTNTEKVKKQKHNNFDFEVEKLIIPEDEIWTYQIDGLQPPRIVNNTTSLKKKITIIVILVCAISLSIFFSIRAVSKDEFDYKEAETGYELVKYSNPGEIKEITIDYVDGDKSKPVTELHEYAFNCDEKIEVINLGKDIKVIDGKSFYSCWNLECVYVDDDNPYFCDIDGVLYTKDLSRIIYYPSAHNIYLAREAGYGYTLPEDSSISNDDFCNAVNALNYCLETGKKIDELDDWSKDLLVKLTKLIGVEEKDYMTFIKDYNDKVGYYVLPSNVKTIGKLAFAYADVVRVYMPEGVKTIETLGFFKAEKLRGIYSYTSDTKIEDTVYSNVISSLDVYNSLPEGLETIESDAFTYDRGITYMYIPSSVKTIGHHAFYNMCYKEDDAIVGLAKMDVASSESEFDKVNIGESWLPKYDSGLLKKNIDVNYSQKRTPVK